jgi:GNAT superfamily N-acetyltransferase
VDVQLTTQRPDRALLVEAGLVYAEAFEAPGDVGDFGERVARYAADRDGFRLATVRDGGGRVAAIGLAVLARPGDWWRDHVARAVGAEAEREHLGEVCLEVVHIAVRPERQRQGFGRTVHDALVGGAPAPTAVLTCHDRALPARKLYESCGWVSIGLLPAEGLYPFHVMSLRLAR